MAYGQPRSSSHPKELKAEAMQLWDNHFMKGRGLSQFRSSGDDDGARVTKAACNDPLQQLNKFQPDSMALKVERMEMKSKTTPVASQQVTTLTSSSKALPINYGLFADFLIEDRSRLARYLLILRCLSDCLGWPLFCRGLNLAFKSCCSFLLKATSSQAPKLLWQ